MSRSAPAIACSMTSQEVTGTGGGESMPSQASTPGRTKVPPCGIIVVTSPYFDDALRIVSMPRHLVKGVWAHGASGILMGGVATRGVTDGPGG
jgi:hypothetical protein